MSRLILIRHGQASYGADDYDVLSPLGVEQARVLGAHLAQRGEKLDALFSGPAKRQIDTAAHVRAAAADLEQPLPEMSVVGEFDEFPAFELFKQVLPKLRRDDEEIRSLLAQGDSGEKHLARVYHRISQKWALGEIDSGDLESFSDFEARVARGLESVVAQLGRGRTVAVVTSGGPIALSMRRSLGISPDVTLSVAWTVVNSSMTEFFVRDGELGLLAFNRIPHITETDLLTYR